MAWRPLLDGALAARARDATLAIADELADCQLDLPYPNLRVDLSAGKAGIALFLGHLSAVTGEQRHEAAATRALDQALDGMSALPLKPSLYGGFTGIAWVAEHLAGGDPDDEVGPIEEVLTTALAADPWAGPPDLGRGLAGYGVYLLERGGPAARACLERIALHLDREAERSGTGLGWGPGRATAEDRTFAWPSGAIELGMAHGVAGIASFLAGGVPLLGDRGRELLAGALSWLWERRLDRSGRLAFPAWHLPDASPAPSPLVYCVGDPGLAVAFLRGGRALDSAIWWDRGVELAREVARRAAGELPEDTGLCHGIAGVAHLLNRFHQATGDDSIGGAARAAFQHLLDAGRRSDGIAGFSTRVERDGRVTWTPRHGFGVGVAGVGLALLGAWSDQEPSWDRCLLTDLEPPPG